MVSFQKARELVLAQARSFGTETVSLEEAFGRVLAEPAFADRDYPPFPRATMDGYALRMADLHDGMRSFRIVETLFAGASATRRIAGGECYKIMTGAPVPADADLVIRREDVTESEESMAVIDKAPEPWRPYLNIARQGEDIRKGNVILGRPCRCGPAVIGMLASLGHASPAVARLPKIAVVTTGDEVVEPGNPVGAAQIRNSNRWMLEAALREEGIVPRSRVHVRDDPQQLKKVIGGVLPADVLIVTGGVSAGDADHVPGVLEELGSRQLFHKISMRPGKPGYCGLLPDGGIVFALPGNPFSCLVHFVLLIAPYLQACWGLTPSLPVGIALAAGRQKRTPLDEFFPVLVEGSPAAATLVTLNGSGDIRLGLGANALALHPSTAGDIPAGSLIDCFALRHS
ncbi:MAG TPA: molybdopterin molybdotransferase MoeA [Puia sp.]|nr:molybdopterin molybdotransferase MoeA [Puia sp.]